MGRDTEKDALFTVGIPRDLDLLQQLKQDAKTRNLSVAKLIVVRLADYYAGVTVAPVAPKAIEEVVEHVEDPTFDDNTLAGLEAWGI